MQTIDIRLDDLLEKDHVQPLNFILLKYGADFKTLELLS